jgi:hypothetical protein
MLCIPSTPPLYSTEKRMSGWPQPRTASGHDFQAALDRCCVEQVKRVEQVKLERAGPRAIFGGDLTGDGEVRQASGDGP